MTTRYLSPSGAALIHHVRLWTLGVEVLNFRLHCSAILRVRCARACKGPASEWGVLLVAVFITHIRRPITPLITTQEEPPEKSFS